MVGGLVGCEAAGVADCRRLRSDRQRARPPNTAPAVPPEIPVTPSHVATLSAWEANVVSRSTVSVALGFWKTGVCVGGIVDVCSVGFCGTGGGEVSASGAGCDTGGGRGSGLGINPSSLRSCSDPSYPSTRTPPGPTNIGTLLTGRRFQRGTMPSLALLNPTRSTQ